MAAAAKNDKSDNDNPDAVVIIEKTAKAVIIHRELSFRIVPQSGEGLSPFDIIL